ncbi:hypothetical protein Neosp_003414 [[Neocosmospora] mangrovei]
MRATQTLLSRSFFGRSMDELKRRTQIAVSFEAIKGATKPKPLYDFNTSNNPNIQRTGFAGFRTPDQRPTVFGRSMWDIDPFLYLALRVKSDGRSYFVNLQTESVEPSDLHQHRLFAKRPGQWETVLIKWNDFVRTNHGFVVEPQTEMLRQKVLSVGVGLTDRVEGPFELCIERVWATNDVSEADSGAPTAEAKAKETPAKRTPAEGGLRNRKGEKVRW